VWRSRVRELPEFAGELPVSALREEIETPGEGQIRAMVTIAGNPVLSTPDGRRLADALDSLDFMVAIDIYLNETTRHADVVLPVTTALERDQYDLVFHGLAVRNTARFTPALLPKEKGTRHDWEVFGALARRLSARLGKKLPLRARLQQRARMTASPRLLLPLLLRGNRYGLTWRALRRHPEGVDLGPLRPCLPERLQTPDKRVDLTPALVVDDLARLRASLESTPTTAADELLLIGRRHARDCNSWLHNSDRLTRGRPRHQLLAHPDDLRERGLADGDVVTVSSRVGSVEVECAASEDLMPGVVSLPHGYGHALPGVRLSHASTVPGVSINDLTDPERLDVSGNAALNGTPVRLSPAAAPAG
jgi:anaerobic selenocysteine-containing dehydrogenase